MNKKVVKEKKDQKTKKKQQDQSGKAQASRDKDTQKKTKKRSRKKHKTFAKKFFIFVILLLMLIVISAIGLYFYSPLGKYTRPVFKNVPYPVAIVGKDRSIVSSRDLIQNTDAVRRLYESQDLSSKGMRVDFSTEKGKIRLKVKEKDVFDKLIENEIVEEFANKKGIFITAEQAQKEIEKKIAKHGDKKSLELSLKSLYGWEVDDFRDDVVIYQMYLRELFEVYALEIKDQQGYKKAKHAKRKLHDDGSNFPLVVKELSEGESAENEGELGWFRDHQLIPEVAEVVFSMEKGQISDVIISSVGFHVIQVQDLREQEVLIPRDDANSEQEESEVQKIKEVKIRQVYVHGKTFLDWIFQQKKEASVTILMKDYFWNSDRGMVEFRDGDMRRQEKIIRAASKGDPSIKNIQ